MGPVPLFWYWNVTVSLKKTNRDFKSTWTE